MDACMINCPYLAVMAHRFPEPVIRFIADKYLAGKSVSTSVLNNRTAGLWKSFMPVRSSIKDPVGTDMYSLQIYPRDYFTNFNPATEFQKWAAIEITSAEMLPMGIEPLVLPGGDYAVFHYKGSSTDHSIFNYIYAEWLPASGYQLDDRPHFEVLGEGYKNADINSEEDIWIPVKAAK